MEPASEVETAGVSDAELTNMKKELTEYGFKEDDLCKEEMSDLLQALRFSKSSAAEEDNLRAKAKDNTSSVEPKHKLLRRYRAVADRRLPWCLLPSNLTPGQKVKCLSAYIKLVSINQYRRARSLSKFEAWAQPLVVSSGGGARGVSTRATRSGRCAPNYALIDEDDDNSLDDFVPRKPRKRKISNTEMSPGNEPGIYSNKVFSLKRKTQKGECPKPEKEIRIEGSSEVSLLNAESPNVVNRDADVEREESASNICSIIDSICNNSSGDQSRNKESSKTIKTRQRKS